MNIINSFGEWISSYACIECIDVSDFVFGQRKVENIDIFVDASFVGGFW